MDNQELFNNIVCALTHDKSVCEECKKCIGNDCAEIRMNLIKELAKKLNCNIPWEEEDD